MALHHSSSGMAVFLRLLTTIILLVLTAMDLYSDYVMFVRLNWVVDYYETANTNLTQFCTCETTLQPNNGDPFLRPRDLREATVAPLCTAVINDGGKGELCTFLSAPDTTGSTVAEDCAVRNNLYAIIFNPAHLNGTTDNSLCLYKNYTIDYDTCMEEIYGEYPGVDTTMAYFQYPGVGTQLLKVYQVRAGVLIFFILAICLSVFFVLTKLRGAYNIYREWKHENDEHKSICYICTYHYHRYKDNSGKISSFKRHLRVAKLHIYIYTLQDLPQHLMFFVAIYYVFTINPSRIEMLGLNPPCPTEYGGDSMVAYAMNRMREFAASFDWNYYVNNYSSTVPPTNEVDLLNDVVFCALASCFVSILMVIYNAFGFVHKVQYVARDSPFTKFLNGFLPSFLVGLEMLMRMGFPVMMIGYLFLFISYSTQDPVNVFWGCVALGPASFIIGTFLFCTLRPRLIRTFPRLVRNTSFELEEVYEMYEDRFKSRLIGGKKEEDK